MGEAKLGYKIDHERSEMEFFNGIFFSRVSRHKLGWFLGWFSTLIFPFYKMIFMNRLKFLFRGFFVRTPREENNFLFKSAGRSDCE